jgi:ATP-dependent RNA helicase RhlE
LTTFANLNLAQPILTALNDEGYTTPTPIQAQAIPPVLAGRDLLGCAQTGTGKTAAFALPILHRLTTAPVDKTRRGPVLPRVLVLSPTRELAAQIGESFATYGRHTGLSGTVIFGGVSQFHQVKALQRGVDILVATPGRLMDLMEQRLVNLSMINTLVLDEADRMLDMGFIQPIRTIAAALPTNRQTLLFSATMPKPIMHLAESLLRDPVKVAVTPVASTATLIEQSVYMVPRVRKPALLAHLLVETKSTRAVVFTRTKHGADKVARQLNNAGIRADAIHGNKAQNQRQRTLNAFRAGQSQVLVATDVAARGLDVDGISHVFNYDLPNEPEAYVHRIGRTGRAGASGVAISFCDHDERDYLRDIERLTGKRIPAVTTLPNIPNLPPIVQTAHYGDLAHQGIDPRDRRAERRSARPGPNAPHHHAHAAPQGHGHAHTPARDHAHAQAGQGAGHHRGPTAGPRAWNKSRRPGASRGGYGR